MAPSSDRVTASFTPHRTASRRGRAGSDVVFTQGCKHQNPRSVPYPVPAHSRSVRSQAPQKKCEYALYTLHTNFRAVAVQPQRLHFSAIGATLLGPEGPVHGDENRPHGLPVLRVRTGDARRRDAPVGAQRRAYACRHLGGDLRIHRLRAASSSPSTPSSSRFSSVAYAVTEPRKALDAPGTAVSVAATMPPVSDSATARVSPLTVSSRTTSAAVELKLPSPSTPLCVRRFPGGAAQWPASHSPGRSRRSGRPPPPSPRTSGWPGAPSAPGRTCRRRCPG